MPKLDTPIHLEMLKQSPKRLSLFKRRGIYGLEWGDPDREPHLAAVRKRFIDPYVSKRTTVLEIGPGGGRWTRYMLGARRFYAVDYHQELIDELRKTYDLPNMEFIKNSGADFPGVPYQSVDFLFSFGVFVHLDLEIIETYLDAMKRVLSPKANVLIQYSDKNKPKARSNPGFSENRPETMIPLIESRGYRILDDERELLDHSSIVRFTL